MIRFNLLRRTLPLGRCKAGGCCRPAVLLQERGKDGYHGRTIPVCQECYDARMRHYLDAIGSPLSTQGERA